jgi:tRNA-modifying protein YgfZ
MPFKVNRHGTTFPALAGFTLLMAEGPDAAAFLQAQLMNDVAALAERQWQWNGWLTPKGRVIALFTLVRLAPTAFVLVLPDFPADELLPALQRFVFRSKVQLRVWSEFRVAAAFDGSVDAPGVAPMTVVGDAGSGYWLDWFGDDGRDALLLLPAASPALAPASSAADARWLARDLARGLPRLPPSQRDAWTPQMLSLERLKAFSLKKGCYPGQEIVARTHYLGQAKRALAGILGPGITVGAQVRDGAGHPAGTAVSATSDGLSGLAVLTVGAPDPLVIDTHPIRRSTLP